MSDIELQTKGERTRQAILEAAFSLFVEQGFHGTSMRQIAERAGVALGGIYNHFESKEEIFDRVLLEKHPYRIVLEILKEIPGETIEEFAHNAARAFVAQFAQSADFISLIFVELSEFKGRHVPDIYTIIVPQFEPLVDRFKGKSERLRELPTRTILTAFAGLMVAYVMNMHVIQPGGASTEGSQVLDQLMQIYLHGILKTEQP